MKKTIKIIFILFLAVGMFSCGKKDDYEPIDYEKEMEEYLKQVEARLVIERPIIADYVNQLDTVDLIKDIGSDIWIYRTSGSSPATAFNYGGGDSPLRSARIIVNFTGRLLNGTIFSELKSTSFELHPSEGLIYAWRAAFYPKEVGGLLPGGLQVGDKVRLVTPSTSAYGASVSGPIPANSPLDFEIEVLSIEQL